MSASKHIIFYHTKRTRVWEFRVKFSMRGGTFDFLVFNSPTNIDIERAKFESKPISVSEYVKSSFPNSTENRKVMDTLLYCPIDKTLWVEENEACNQIIELMKGMITYYEGRIGHTRKEGVKALELYSKVMKFYNTLTPVPVFKIKSFLDLNKLSREEKREMLLEAPWNGYGWVSGRNDPKFKNLYDDIYKKEPIILSKIKKSFQRKAKAIKKVRPLKKKEQEFFALIGAVKNMKQLNKIR